MIYWDYNGSAPIRPEVAALLAESFRRAPELPGNASSVHRGGRAARGRLDDARARIAKALRCEPKEVCFTGSGAEADALALKGVFLARKDRVRTKVVTTSIEHPALLAAAAQLEAQGAQVLRLKPGSDGQVSEQALLAALTPDVALCSLMWANNETGVLQPVEAVAKACKERGILFHTDAVQAVGKVEVSLKEVPADLLSLSAHKLGGPPGVGALIVKRGVELQALTPGHQEWGRRGGTQNVFYAEALALALELSTASLASEGPRLSALRSSFEERLCERIPDVRINGAGAPRVPNTSNVHFVGADGEALLIALDLAGICASSGAACASGSLSPSHVLTAMGLSPADAHGSVRFSMGPTSTQAEVEKVVEVLVAQVPRAREAAGSLA